MKSIKGLPFVPVVSKRSKENAEVVALFMCKFVAGVVVPIPTFPVLCICNAVVKKVLAVLGLTWKDKSPFENAVPSVISYFIAEPTPCDAPNTTEPPLYAAPPLS